jgi:leader peptidase (prepilin peptidase) / N-methyltransferase
MEALGFLPDWGRSLGGALLGAILGSYIGALCSRWPAGLSVMAGRSRCDGCRTTLTIKQLIPVISFLAQDGRCSKCAAPIGRTQIFAELAAMAAGASAFLWLPPQDALRLALMIWLLLPLIILDIKYFWLPDSLVAALAISGLVSGLLLVSDYNWGLHLGAAAICWLALEGARIGYQRMRGIQGMGAGDPKLLAALALWIAPLHLPYLLFASSGLGLIYAIAMHSRENVTENKLPFGAFLAIAAIAIYWFVEIF